ncbi:uncharacterized protein N7506_007748 [Penicillium brevicompactum]|uniref:uncharacterized protein n=1 Tax=Penicillium brevicompactum TaxID=5074 RepID=UPI00254267B8|nr:uncharacterized protein N7506_007748 [Penicillium brevicompactum]KAJ5333965.1 hypothetical protein N7506_007748 [Penicillium brevicompactum]
MAGCSSELDQSRNDRRINDLPDSVWRKESKEEASCWASPEECLVEARGDASRQGLGIGFPECARWHRNTWRDTEH